MGQSVLAVPVPALEEVVRQRTAWYDPSFVSTDPTFVHAHITVLAPWLATPSARDLAAVADVARSVEPSEVTLRDVKAFPDGVIHLRPDRDELLRKLTAMLTAEFPECPPYAGLFPDPVPHLTLDHVAGGVTLEEVRARLAPHLPITVVADRIDLQWWANHDCRRITSWPLGGGL